MRLFSILLASLIALPLSVGAHPGHTPRGGEVDAPVDVGGKGEGPRASSRAPEVNNDTDALPNVIKTFDVVRFTRSEFRTLGFRLETNPNKVHIEGMSNDLARKAAEAGKIAPLAVGQLFFKMWNSTDKDARTNILAREAAALSDEQAKFLSAAAETGATSRAVKRKLRSNQTMLALVTSWQADPMDGVK